MAIAPWLNIQPADYLQAAVAGRDAGMRMASLLNNIGDDQQSEARADRSQSDQEAQQKAQDLLRTQSLALTARQDASQNALRAAQVQNQTLLDNNRTITSLLNSNRKDDALNALNQFNNSKLNILGENAQTAEERAANATKKIVRGPNGSNYLLDTSNNQLSPLVSGDTTGEVTTRVNDILKADKDLYDKEVAKGAEADPGTLSMLKSDIQKQTNLLGAQPLSPTITPTQSTPQPAATPVGLINGQPIAQFLNDGTSSAPVAPTPAAKPTAPQPLPKTKDALVNGQWYLTAKGPAFWNGNSFEQP